MRKRVTLVFVMVASKVMVLNALTLTSVQMMTHVQSMPLVPTQMAVILVAVTKDMKVTVWFVENKPGVKT